jgi:uncharacterized BrkB/YihY/UPF0761 family membrane protein
MAISTAKYLLRTDVHTFAFSVAANSILSFFPFVVLLMTLIRRVFHSPVMLDIVKKDLRDYLPAGQEFVIRHLDAMINARHRVQIASLVILLVTSTGGFYAAGGRAQPHLAFPHEPLLLWQSIDLARPGFRLRSAGAAFRRHDGG